MRRTCDDEDEDDILKCEAVTISWNFRFDLDPTCPSIIRSQIHIMEESAIGDGIHTYSAEHG